MSADWEVGDLALCISARPNSRGMQHPCRVGGVYTVEAVVVSETSGILGLCLVGVVFPGCTQNGDFASHYRKVTPPKADAFDLETINLMNPKPVEAANA